MGNGFKWVFARALAVMAATAFALPATASQVTYYHTDALGSVVMESDAGGQVTYRQEYRPYGESVLDAPKDGPAFTGHVADAATGLTYMQQRYYDPTIPRFLSVDPVTADANTGANFNRYAYANNNPYKFKDPDGRESACISMGGNCGMGPGTGQKIMEVAPVVADFTPGIGDIKGIVEAVLDPSVANVAAAGVGLIPVVGDGAAKLIKGADKIADGARALPKPPTGPGRVPKSERDPKRLFDPQAREAKRAEQGHQCANGCGTKIDGSNSAGHHIERHADGGRTVPENHAEVCTECHKNLHSGD